METPNYHIPLTDVERRSLRDEANRHSVWLPLRTAMAQRLIEDLEPARREVATEHDQGG